MEGAILAENWSRRSWRARAVADAPGDKVIQQHVIDEAATASPKKPVGCKGRTAVAFGGVGRPRPGHPRELEGQDAVQWTPRKLGSFVISRRYPEPRGFTIVARVITISRLRVADRSLRLAVVRPMRTAASTVASSKSAQFQPAACPRCGFREESQVRRPERVRLVLRPDWGAPGRPQGREPHGVAPARKMARRDKRHRRSGRPVVQHDIQKTRFVQRIAAQTAGLRGHGRRCTPEKWAGRGFHNNISPSRRPRGR